MTRISDGLLFLEIEDATEVQLRTGLGAARGYLARSGAMIEDAMEALASRQRAEQLNPVWECEPADYDNELADIAEEAFMAALEAAGGTSGEWGLIENYDARDLFECMA